MTDKTKMIYNDDQTIGVDEQSLNKFDLLFNHNNSPDGQPNWFKDGNLNKYYEVNQWLLTNKKMNLQ